MFIELTNVDGQSKEWVRPESISAKRVVPSGTELNLAGGHTVIVKESPGEIRRRERQMNEESQQRAVQR